MTEKDQAELVRRLGDPVWRLTSGELYKIAPADGSGIQPFLPRPEQRQIIEAIYRHGVKRLLIPKARRLGMSTTLGVIAADMLLFNRTWQGSLIDQNAADAGRKLDRIVRVALENLPAWLQERVKFPKSNQSQITVNVDGSGERSFYAGMNARGGSNDFLWVSEWGVIQHEDPKRSSKIRAGALPSARHGITVVETTWAGGKGGDLWELIEPVINGSSDDWQVMFFPWWIDPRNVHATAAIDEPAHKYFEKIAPRLTSEGIVLTDPQRRWWASERRAQGIFMQRENPTFLDECWSAAVKGAIYAEEIERARTEGRVSERMPIDGSNLVHTSWDLGSPKNTAVWYFQVIGRVIRVIDCDHGGEETLTQRVARMQRYSLGCHYLPHDAASRTAVGSSVVEELSRIGLPNLRVVPRTHDIWVGINDLKELLPNLEFRLPACEAGLTALCAYHIHPRADGAGLVRDEPVHDWSSHFADSLRIMAEAVRAGLLKFNSAATMARPEDVWRRPRKKLEMRVGG